MDRNADIINFISKCLYFKDFKDSRKIKRIRNKVSK